MPWRQLYLIVIEVPPEKATTIRRVVITRSALYILEIEIVEFILYRRR